MTETVERFKVLTRDGASAHGGSYAWDLPTEEEPGVWTPGAWTPAINNPLICQHGYHLTTDPMQWAVVGMRIFAAEADQPEPAAVENDKSVHRSVRLIAERADLIPEYWRKVEHFVTVEMPAVPWLSQTGPINPAWQHFTASAWMRPGLRPGLLKIGRAHV